MPKPTKKQYRQTHPSKDKRKEGQRTGPQPEKRHAQKFNASDFGQNLVSTTPNRSKAIEHAKAIVVRLGLTGHQAEKQVTAIMNSYDSVIRGHVGINRKRK